MHAQPAVTVVCATYRRPAAVDRLLRALAAQDLDRPFEVLICDDGSGADVVTELRRLVATSDLDVVLLEQPKNRGAATARNVAWRRARAPFVAFTDDDCQPHPGWLRAGLARMEAGAPVVVGRVTPDPAQAASMGPWSRTLVVSSARYFQTANAFYRTADLAELDGFDASLVFGGEDTDLGLRLCELRDVQPQFAPEALVLHDVRAGGAWALARMSATRWVDLPLVLRKHPALRSSLTHRRVFWKPSHPPTLLAAAGLALAPVQPWLLVMTAPWLWHRTVRAPRSTGRLRRLQLLPGMLLVDTAEVVACVRGSVRHRTVLL